MNKFQIPDDPLYEKAKQILQANPMIGKVRLGAVLGIRAPSSRLRIVRYRGETEGHSNHPDYVRVRELKEKHLDWSVQRIAQTLGISMDHARLHISRWYGALNFQGNQPVKPSAQPTPEPEPPPGGAELQVSGGDNNQAVSYRGSRIRSIEDLLAFSQTDTRIWEVERHVINKWEVGAKDPVNGGILTEPLFQLKVWLRRRVVEKKLETLMGQLLDQFRKAAPILPAVHYETTNRRGLLEVSLMDMHLGKYCSETGTGRAFNADICEHMFTRAVEDLLAKTNGLNPEKILFVVGNDMLNTDHLGRETTAGTPQSCDITYQEAFVRGRKLLVSAILTLRQKSPVEVIVVPGNHDTQVCYYLGDSLAGWLHATSGVTVENSPRPRKYLRFHRNLIGFTHGHNEKHHDLPLLLATEDPEGWAQSRHREFHLGHFHARKHKMFVPSFDRAGVLVRILPSLCPPDAWHASMGYNARLAAEALFFDPEEGCVATYSHAPN